MPSMLLAQSEPSALFSGIFGIVLLLVSIAFYVLPGIVASARGHHNAVAI